METSKIIDKVFDSIKVVFECLILQLIIIIVTLSSKEPLENHIIDDLNKYFNYIPNITIYDN